MVYLSPRQRILKAAGALALLLALAQTAFAQSTAGSDATAEPRYLIDVPTAGMLANRTMIVDLNYFQDGGVLAGMSVGLFNRLLIGASFGGTNLVGVQAPQWNKNPGWNVKLRLMEESIMMPAIALGFDSQGKDGYIDSAGRYTIKSTGFYAVGSKNFLCLWFLAISGGLNYSLEDAEQNKNINGFVGVEKTIGPFISAIGEYNAAWNDQSHQSLGRGRGYINLGVRSSFGNGFTIGLNLKDVLRNQQDISIGNRTLQLEYIRSF